MLPDKPFTWREVEFRYIGQRAAFVGRTTIAGRELWFMVKDLTPPPPVTGYASFQAWVEWQGGHTISCTMPDRTDALEGARVELLDCARHYHEELVRRFG